MATIGVSDATQWKALWGEFRNHKTKARGGFISALPPDLTDLEMVRLQDYARTQYGPSSEQTRQSLLYVDFSPIDRSWSSPREVDIDSLSEVRSQVQESLSRADETRKRGLFSPRALEINKEVFSEFSLPDISGVVDSESYSEVLGEHTRKLLRRNHERLVQEGFNPPPPPYR